MRPAGCGSRCACSPRRSGPTCPRRPGPEPGELTGLSAPSPRPSSSAPLEGDLHVNNYARRLSSPATGRTRARSGAPAPRARRRGCRSTAWVAGNGAVHGTLGAMFPLEAHSELFADGLPVIATGFSPWRAKTEPAPGGTYLSGDWDFCSGINYSQWVVLQALGEQGPVAHLVPISDVVVLDNWNTSGLRGTGSHDVHIDRVFVPSHRLLNMAAAGDGDSIGAREYGTTSLRLPLAQVFG